MRVLLCVLFLSVPLSAQEPVSVWPDRISWATAFVNPTVATVQALSSDQKKCLLGRLALSEAIENATVLTLKHFIVSERPCLGCAPDGMPSGHSANSMIGSFSWNFGIAFGATTGSLRMAAHRHTPWQVAAGLLVGTASEAAGRLVRCE